jgi:hypothetical protein
MSGKPLTLTIQLDPAKEARRRARQGIGAAPVEKLIPNKRRKPTRLKGRTKKSLDKFIDL